MEIKNYLSAERVIFGIKATSKEDIIKELASYFLNDNTVIEKQDFDTLL